MQRQRRFVPVETAIFRRTATNVGGTAFILRTITDFIFTNRRQGTVQQL